MARSEGLQPVLDAIVAAARRLCNGDHAQLYLAQGDVLVIVSQVLDTPEGYDYAVEHPHRRDRTTVVGRTALAGEAVQIPDVLADADYSFGAQRLIGYRALLGVPVFLDDALIGVVGVGRSAPGPFVDREVELVKTFADQAAIAIANARLLDAVERQRKELSRFLSPQVAELISSRGGRAAARRPPRVHHVPLLRPARLHRLRRDGRARGALRRAARISRARSAS